MKSLKARMSKMNNRGQTINLVTASIAGIFTMVLIIIFLLFTVSSLNPASLFTAGSAEQTATNELTGNLTETASSIGGKLPTIGLMLVVLLILAVFVLVILYLRRAQQSTSGGGGTI